MVSSQGIDAVNFSQSILELIVKLSATRAGTTFLATESYNELGLKHLAPSSMSFSRLLPSPSAPFSQYHRFPTACV
jgi:hypothetical protein